MCPLLLCKFSFQLNAKRFRFASIYFMSLFILTPMSTLAMSDTADFSGSFGGSTYNVETSTHVFPSGAEGWAGFSNQNSDLYPLRFSDEGMITFNGSVPSGGEVAVRFKLERLPHPNTEPSYSSETVTISGVEEASYSVVIPSQGENTFSSLILYLVTQDEAAVITDVIVDGETVIVDEPAGPEIFAVGDVIDFETDVAVESFGGTNGSLDVDGNGNMFLSVLKGNGAQTWAGNTLGKGDYVYPLTDTDSLMSANVYSAVAVPVRMKLENSANGDQNASVTVDHSGSGWEILTFDFAGTNAIGANFDTLALFPNYGNVGAGNTYQFDDIKFEGGNSSESVDPVDPSLLDFSGTFGGASYDEETSTFVFPSAGEGWAGFSNQNSDLYPLSFSEDGNITFSGSVPSGGDVNIRFKLEYQPHPDTEPSYYTEAITVSGTEVASYVVEIPSQGNNTFSSLILYVNERDIPVVITDVDMSFDAEVVDPCSYGADIITIEAESFTGFTGDIDSQVTTDICGSENMAWIDADDSMTYTINVPSSGNYAIAYRVASEFGSSPGFELYVDDAIVDVQGVVATGGWQTWVTIVGRVIALDAGDRTIKWKAVSGGMNINWFNLSPTDAVADDAPVLSDPEPSVSFTVTTSGSSVKMHSSAFGWNLNDALIATDNGNGTWTATIDPGPLVDLKYKWIVDDVQEDLSATYRAGNCSNDNISAVDDTWFNRVWVYGAGDVTGDVPSACIGDDQIDPASGQFTGAFGNTVIDGDNFIFPSSADSWGGFSNENSAMYPISFVDAGSITFNGAVPSGESVDVRFRFEKNPHPDTEPSFDTDSVTIISAESNSYTVSIPSQGNNTFSSFIMYVVTQDIEVTITDIVVNSDIDAVEPDGPMVLSLGDVIDFESDVAVESFGGANGLIDTDGNGNLLLSVVKNIDSQTWAGNTIGKGNYVYPLTASDSIMSVNVYSTIAAPVRMKLENSANGDQNDSVTVDHSGTGWETLIFDFAGSNAIDANFDTLVLFPNYGNAGAGNTYQFDDITFGLADSTSPSGSWDFDQDGNADALTDGLLLLRYAFGLTGDALVSSAIAEASPLTPAQVQENVAASTASFADIDDSGNVDALTDGLLLLRYLFGLTGDALIASAVAQNANRSSADDIEAYIESLIP